MLYLLLRAGENELVLAVTDVFGGFGLMGLIGMMGPMEMMGRIEAQR